MLVKLLLNTKDFDNKLKKSGKELEGFAAVGAKGLNGLVAGFGKIAAAAGVAAGGFELFNKGMQSSQRLTDSYGRSIETIKVGFDNFMYGIANADFTSFNDGLREMAERAREMYDAFDQLANTRMSASFATTLDQSRYRELMATARNKSLSPEERKAALAEAQALGEQIKATAVKVEADSYTALKSMFAAKAGAESSIFTPAMIEEAFRIDARATSAADRKAIEESYKAYMAEMRKAEGISGTKVVSYGFGGVANTEFYGDAAKEARVKADIQKRYADTLVKYIALMRLSDNELQTSMNTYTSAVQQRNAAAEIETSTNELRTTMNNEAATAAQKEQKALEKAAEAGRKVADEMARAYNTSGFDTSIRKGVKLDNSDIAQINFVGKSAARRYSVADPRADLPKTIGMIDTGKLMENIKLPESVQASKLAESAEGFGIMSDAVNALSDAFDTLGTSEENAVGMLFNFVDAAGQAISKTLEMISYIAAETAARRASQNAATGEAAAKTMAKWAAVPGGIAIATAAIGSIIAAINAIPKFAEGGIVTSATLGVFGEAGPEAVMPLDKLKDFVGSRDVRVTGRIVGQGKDLAVIIDNYNKVRRVKS